MDEEAIEKIAQRLAYHADCEWQYMTDERKSGFCEIAKDIIQYLRVLGYRKLPQDKPPLLVPWQIDKAIAHAESTNSDKYDEVIQSQREADIKHYGG